MVYSGWLILVMETHINTLMWKQSGRRVANDISIAFSSENLPTLIQISIKVLFSEGPN